MAYRLWPCARARSRRDFLWLGLLIDIAASSRLATTRSRRIGLPARIRTGDLRLRRPLLYPSELRAAGLRLSVIVVQDLCLRAPRLVDRGVPRPSRSLRSLGSLYPSKLRAVGLRLSVIVVQDLCLRARKVGGPRSTAAVAPRSGGDLATRRSRRPRHPSRELLTSGLNASSSPPSSRVQR